MNHETWTQLIKNDIIPSQEDKREQMHSRLQEEESLSFLEENLNEKLGEGIKSLMNHHLEPPWRTPVNKGMKRKRSWKPKVNPCNDSMDLRDEINWESLEPWKRKMNNWDQDFWWGSGIRN